MGGGCSAKTEVLKACMRGAVDTQGLLLYPRTPKEGKRGLSRSLLGSQKWKWLETRVRAGSPSLGVWASVS